MKRMLVYLSLRTWIVIASAMAALVVFGDVRLSNALAHPTYAINGAALAHPAAANGIGVASTMLYVGLVIVLALGSLLLGSQYARPVYKGRHVKVT